MKKFIIATMLLAGTSLAHADYTVKNADGSALSQLCVAAVMSPEILLSTARSQGLTLPELDSVRCNGMALKMFSSKYSSKESKAPVGYILSKSDESPVTALCIAAARSEQEYQQVKSLYFTPGDNVEAEVMCNGMPVKTFGRKYRTAALSISAR